VSRRHQDALGVDDLGLPDVYPRDLIAVIPLRLPLTFVAFWVIAVWCRSDRNRKWIEGAMAHDPLAIGQTVCKQHAHGPCRRRPFSAGTLAAYHWANRRNWPYMSSPPRTLRSKNSRSAPTV
jgi:hypothetical protein